MNNASCDAVLDAVVAAARERLGSRLACVATIGSLAHGGFSAVSDVDVAVILHDAGDDVVDGAWLAAIADAARAADPALAARLSIFWGDRALARGRFPPLYRLDLVDHGVPLFGAIPSGIARPTGDEVRAQLLGSSIAYWARHTAKFAAEAPAGEDKELVRCLLYPARLALSWQTGGIASNDAAVGYLIEHAPPTVARAPVTTALAFRHGRVPFAALLPFRAALASQYQETLRWLGIPAPLAATS